MSAMSDLAIDLARVTTWSDGFGVWHAHVPYGSDHPEYLAAEAIRAEVNARQGHQVRRVPVARDGFNSRGTYFREDWPS